VSKASYAHNLFDISTAFVNNKLFDTSKDGIAHSLQHFITADQQLLLLNDLLVVSHYFMFKNFSQIKKVMGFPMPLLCFLLEIDVTIAFKRLMNAIQYTGICLQVIYANVYSLKRLQYMFYFGLIGNLYLSAQK